MKKLLLCLALLVPAAWAQSSGFITSNQCFSATASGLTQGAYSITGTWTGTITAYGVVGQGAQVSLGSQTANGSFTVSVSGYTLFQVCGNSVGSGAAFVQVYTNSSGGSIAIVSSAPSGSCSAGANPQLVSSTGALYTCQSGTWAQVSGSGSGFPVTAAQTVSSNGAITPTGTGQLASSGDWIPQATGTLVPPVPTVTLSNTGGSLTQNQVYIRLTYVGPSTIVPSGELKAQLTTTSCASNSTCQITVNMPTTCQSGSLPSGVTGCTVWDGTTSDAEKQQAASAACVNITTATCVINTLAAGSTIATPSAQAGVSPTPLTSISQPDFLVCSNYMQLADGTWVCTAGVDYSGLNVLTNNPQTNVLAPAIGGAAGTFTWTHRFFFNDTNAPPIISNAMVSIHHQEGQTTGTASAAGQAGVDDRAFAVEMIDANTANPFTEQSLSQYNERIITNNSITCAPINGGSPWGESCAAAGRFVLGDNRTAPTSSGNFGSPIMGLAGVASSVTSTNAFSSCSPPLPCVVGVMGGAFEANNSQNGQGSLFAGGYFGAGGGGSNTNGSGAGVVTKAPTTRFATSNYGVLTADEGSNLADWNIYSQAVTPATTGKNLLSGISYMYGIDATNSTLPLLGSLNVTGGVLTTQATAAPNANGNNIFTNGTAGSSTDSYKVFGVDANGNEGASFTTSIATANANLTSSNSVSIQINTPLPNGYSSYNVYRTAAASTCNGVGCTNGKIGNVATGFIGTNGTNGSNLIFTDTGQVGDGNSTAGQANTTGGAVLPGTERDGGTCRILSDVSLTVNTANPFCSFNLPATALGWAFKCDVLWAITAGTGTNNLALGVNASQTPAATTNALATIVTATSGTQTNGSAAISASGAINVLTGATYTPAATVLPAGITGTLSANAAAGTFAITATANGTTATAAVKAGTLCRIF